MNQARNQKKPKNKWTINKFRMHNYLDAVLDSNSGKSIELWNRMLDVANARKQRNRRHICRRARSIDLHLVVHRPIYTNTVALKKIAVTILLVTSPSLFHPLLSSSASRIHWKFQMDHQAKGVKWSDLQKQDLGGRIFNSRRSCRKWKLRDRSRGIDLDSFLG